jgi:hypothetical protein
MRTREPENLRRLVGLWNEIINRATESGHLFWLYPYDGAVCINNTFKTPVYNLHFGYPGRTRFCKFLLFLSIVLSAIDIFSDKIFTIHGSGWVQCSFNPSPTCTLTFMYLVLADLARKSCQASGWHLADIYRRRGYQLSSKACTTGSRDENHQG